MKPQTVARSLAVLLCVSLLIHVDRQALGDEDSDRAERESLMPAIQSDLENVSKQLNGIADASSDDGIKNAIGYARSMEQNVGKLERVKGNDSAASSIADRYPNYLKDFYEAANALLKLKNAQLVQEQRGLWKSCSEEDKNLREAVKPYLDPPDPSGLEKIPQLAENAKSKIHDDFARQLGQESDIASAYGEAKRFSVSEGGGWSDVTSRMRQGADGTWSKYEAPLKDTKEKCAELDKGKEHPFIVESLGKLTGANASSKQLIEDILKDWGAWKELRRELAAKYVVNADKVRMAICDGDEEQIQSRVEEAETAAQGNLKSGYETLDKELDQLIERVGKLEDDKGVGAEARKWRGVMRGAKTRLVKVLQDGGILQGVQNAKVRARIQIGIDKHAQLQTGCTAHEYQIPDGRIDCLNVSDGHCEVIEIKPNNEKARAKGREQLDRYKATIVGLHADNKLPGLLERCVKDGQLNIEYDVEIYEFCPVPDEDIDAMLAEQAKQSASTADE
jgi:hypothetical protein